MIDFFKELMEQALELELAVRFTKQEDRKSTRLNSSH